MKIRGPLLTLVVVASLALVLLGINVAGEPQAAPGPAAAAVNSGTTAPTATAPPRAIPTVATPSATVSPPPTGPTAAGAGFPVEVAFAGRTAGNEATIAVAVKGGRAVAYVCDGKKVEAWLEGTAHGSELRLAGPKGSAVRGSLADGAVFGQIVAGGKQWAFSAQTAMSPAGAYRGGVSVRGVTKRIGWTVLQDGTVTGLAFDGTAVAPAPALDPVARTATLDGVPVQVTSLTGTDDVTEGDGP